MFFNLPLNLFSCINPSTILRDQYGRFLPGHKDISPSSKTHCKNCGETIPGFRGLRVESGCYCNGTCYVMWSLRDWLRRHFE